jgi:hypothetical protein
MLIPMEAEGGLEQSTAAPIAIISTRTAIISTRTAIISTRTAIISTRTAIIGTVTAIISTVTAIIGTVTAIIGTLTAIISTHDRTSSKSLHLRPIKRCMLRLHTSSTPCTYSHHHAAAASLAVACHVRAHRMGRAWMVSESEGQGRAQSRRRCGRVKPSPGADVAGVSPQSRCRWGTHGWRVARSGAT